jgi:hypothetical protein
MAISEKRKRFNLLFSQARARGDDVFEFEGKRYSTERADDKKKSAEKESKKEADDLGPTGKAGIGRIVDTMTEQDKRYVSAMGNLRAMKQKEKDEEAQRESGSFKKGGKVMNENMMMKKEGRGMAKASMQKVADKAVKGHEKRMHKMAGGGLAAGHKAADGIAKKGKTRCKMV